MKYILLLLCFSCTSLFAQTIKYFDNDSLTISKKQFENWRANGTLRIKIGESKDTVYYQAVKRYHITKLSDNEKQQLYTYLSTISGQELDMQVPILIRYHQGIDPCNVSGTADVASHKYWHQQLVNKLNEKEKVNTLVVYSDANRVAELYPGVPAYFDKDKMLNKFFKLHYPCGSVMVINPNGYVAYFYGEYAQETVMMLYDNTKAGKG